jgi:Uma2 family endonuclease
METVSVLPQSRPLSRADLEQVPDDGHRYELIDGALVVTPAPSPRHQFVIGRLYIALLATCPPGLRVAFAPLDVALADDTVLQPDLLVARDADFTQRDLPVAPLLAVEVISPSTRRIDWMLKRSRFEAARCPAYWVIDPEEPSLTAWDLQGDEYTQVAHVVGDQEYAAATPYAVAISPSGLLD